MTTPSTSTSSTSETQQSAGPTLKAGAGINSSGSSSSATPSAAAAQPKSFSFSSNTQSPGFSFSGSPQPAGQSLFRTSAPDPAATTTPATSLFGSSSAAPTSSLFESSAPAPTGSSQSAFGWSVPGSSFGSTAASVASKPVVFRFGPDASSSNSSDTSSSNSSSFGVTSGSLFGTSSYNSSIASTSSLFGSVSANPSSSTAPFGGASAVSSVSRPHPMSLQVPPTTTQFTTPAPAPAVSIDPSTPATAQLGDVAKAASDTEAKTASAKEVKTTPKKSKVKKKQAPVVTLALDEADGSVAFASRGSEFRYRLTLTKRETLQLWLEDKSSKQQWESAELTLGEVVPPESALPMMELQDYYESFKSCLLAAESSASSKAASKRKLVDLDKSGEQLQLELTLAVQIFSKVLTPTYRFTLQRVPLSEMDILAARLRDQDEELAELRDEVDDLRAALAKLSTQPASACTSAAVASPVYMHARTGMVASTNCGLEWTATDVGGPPGAIQLSTSGTILFLHAGLYSVQVVVHHTNAHRPVRFGESTGGLFGPSPEQPAFHLIKDRVTVATCFGSSEQGTIQSSSLVHVVQMQPHGELKIVYVGNGIAKEGSYIIIFKIK